ncbi:MAG: ABC transporter permease [Bacteroidales bacterium]
MIRNYLLIAIRNALRNLTVSLINIIGLSIGLTCTMLIYLWVTHELSFDRFHQRAEDMYRVEEDQHYTNGVYHVTVTPWPSGPVWKEKIPEIEEACRVTNAGSLLLRYKDKAFYEDGALAVDSGFFKLFSFQLLQGEADKLLRDPGSIVISAQMAEKYFGKENPLGKTLEVNNAGVFQVSGVMAKMPANSTLQGDFLLPFDYMKKSMWYSEEWGNNSIWTYVRLKQGSSVDEVNKKLTAVVKEHNPDTQTDFLLFPFTRVHLYSYFGYDHSPGGILNVYIFSVIALLVLIIACINFMNLGTAKASTRAKEIGLRKVSGAQRKNLVIQFFGESFLMSFVSMLVAFIITGLLLQPFNLISGKDFSESVLLTPVFLCGALIITVFAGFLAGIYPAIVLSAFRPVKTMRGDLSMGMKGGWFRKSTVIVQFALSILLITSTIVIYRQLSFMQSQALGYDKENLLYIPIRGDLAARYPSLKQELLKESLVKAVSASSHPPYQIGSNSGGAYWEGKDPQMQTLVSMSGVDFDYVEAMGIQMKSGRAFSREYPGDAAHDTVASFLVNESMEKLMGKENAVGTILSFMGYKGPIVGVMKDFHYQSLRYTVEPLAVALTETGWANFIFMRLAPGDLKSSMKQLETAWNRILPDYPFDYHFVDDDLDRMYRSEQRISSLMNYFAALAILIACIGLYGLATFTAERKTREIGIRKALGAPVSSILYLFSGEFVQLLLIASAIAIPVAWYLLKQWLLNFGYRTTLDGWIFISSALGSLLVALLAISYQAFRSASVNPAETLKYE